MCIATAAALSGKRNPTNSSGWGRSRAVPHRKLLPGGSLDRVLEAVRKGGVVECLECTLHNRGHPYSENQLKWIAALRLILM